MAIFKDFFNNVRTLLFPQSSVELGSLLPTLPRKYFTSIDELPFHPVPELDLANAWWCAEAAMLAYHETTKVIELTAGLSEAGWQLQTFGDQLRTYAVLLRSSKVAILAFRGTRVRGFRTVQEVFTQPPVKFADLRTDFAFIPKNFPRGGIVHEGFLEAADEFWTIYGKQIVELVGSRECFVTGHSLGAALATVAAQLIAHVRALYTYGSPRVGNGAFRNLFLPESPPTFRFVHGLDLITTIPPEGVLEFTHVGDILHIRGDGSGVDQQEHSLVDVLANSTTLPIPVIRDAVVNLFEGRLVQPLTVLIPRNALADHAPIFYVEKLRKLALH